MQSGLTQQEDGLHLEILAVHGLPHIYLFVVIDYTYAVDCNGFPESKLSETRKFRTPQSETW